MEKYRRKIGFFPTCLPKENDLFKHILVLEYFEVIVKIIMIQNQGPMLCSVTLQPAHLEFGHPALGKTFPLSLPTNVPPSFSFFSVFTSRSPSSQPTHNPICYTQKQKKRRREVMRISGRKKLFHSPQPYWLIFPQIQTTTEKKQKGVGRRVGGKEMGKRRRRKWKVNLYLSHPSW